MTQDTGNNANFRKNCLKSATQQNTKSEIMHSVDYIVAICSFEENKFRRVAMYSCDYECENYNVQKSIVGTCLFHF